MSESPIAVLLVEDDPRDARAVRNRLANTSLLADVQVAGSVADAATLLQADRFDVVLLDLFLPDASGMETLRMVLVHAPDTPIVVLTSRRHQTIGIQAVRAGAQDFLTIEGMNGEMLVRGISYAIERYRLLDEIRTASIRDDLTGLYNRRGFIMLAEQQIRLALRNVSPMTLFFVDVDDMKAINDNFGHQSGDEALREVADCLRRTFRRCDILARIGGDEFVALALDSDSGGSVVIANRLLRNMADETGAADRRYQLTVSTGVVVFDPDDPLPLNELISRADSAMYEQKRSKLSPRGAFR